MICGADVQGSDLILVGVAQDREGGFVLVPEVFAKLTLADGKDQATVRGFSGAVAAFVRNHNVREIALRGRNTSGQLCRSPGQF